MIGAIAGQGGFDPVGKTPQIASADSTSTTYYNVLSVSGSGVLIGITQTAAHTDATYRNYIKIVIDGVTIFDGTFETCLGAGAGLPMFFPFTTSLLIQARCSNSTQTVTVAAALLN